MKHSRWIYMIAALTLFSAHQTRRQDTDKPEYVRGPAMVHPIMSPAPAANVHAKKSLRKKAQNPAAARFRAF
jgi:hypothetical protein